MDIKHFLQNEYLLSRLVPDFERLLFGETSYSSCFCALAIGEDIWQPHMEFTKYSVCRNIVWFHKGMMVKMSSYLFSFRISNILLKKNLTSKYSIKWWVSGSQTHDLSNQSCESIQTTVNVESYLYSVINNVLVKVSINISGSRIFIHIRCIVLELVNLM